MNDVKNYVKKLSFCMHFYSCGILEQYTIQYKEFNFRVGKYFKKC
jgi:hypothetical protein